MDVAALLVGIAGLAATTLALYFGLGQVGLARRQLRLTHDQIERVANATEAERATREATLRRFADNMQLSDVSFVPGAAQALEEQIAAGNFIGARHSVRELRARLIRIRAMAKRTEQDDREAIDERITAQLALVGDLSDRISKQIAAPGMFDTLYAREIVDSLLDMSFELDPANRMKIT